MTWALIIVTAVLAYTAGRLRSLGFPDYRIRYVEALAEADELRARVVERQGLLDGARADYVTRLEQCAGCHVCTPPQPYLDYSQNVTTEET